MGVGLMLTKLGLRKGLSSGHLNPAGMPTQRWEYVRGGHN